jgi:hypothetical protein
MQLVLERGAAGAATLRGLLHTADLVTVMAGNTRLSVCFVYCTQTCFALRNAHVAACTQDPVTVVELHRCRPVRVTPHMLAM